MRTHDEAAQMMGERARAAAGIDVDGRVTDEPERLARVLLGDLVPLEELEHVLNGIGASVVNILDAFDALDGDKKLTADQKAMGKAGSLFVAIAQENAYALLMAGLPEAQPWQAPDGCVLCAAAGAPCELHDGRGAG